jgi:hypothetical protein
MTSEWPYRNPTRRDELISLARYGKITPAEAEAEAAANGWSPFARQPELPALDPMREIRWSLVMTVCWVAWRDILHVRENSADVRSESTLWVHREWNEPVDGSFVRQQGWFLESWSAATTVRLSMHEKYLAANDQLPELRKMSILEAERELWRALGQAEIVAEALNADGRPGLVPALEWSYLTLFEDGKRDVLKYAALDREVPFSDIKFKRDDILRLWPAHVPEQVSSEPRPLIEKQMLDSLPIPSTAGLVSLCAALHWIMTHGGARPTALDDADSWRTACDQLFAKIHIGEIKLIGLPRGSSFPPVLVMVRAATEKRSWTIMLNFHQKACRCFRHAMWQAWDERRFMKPSPMVGLRHASPESERSSCVLNCSSFSQPCRWHYERAGYPAPEPGATRPPLVPQ